MDYSHEPFRQVPYLRVEQGRQEECKIWEQIQKIPDPDVRALVIGAALQLAQWPDPNC
jgi:hypothetical protein